MKKLLLLFFGLFFWVSFYGQNLVVGTQTSLSTAPIYPGYGAACFGDIEGAGKLDIVGEISNPYQYLGVVRDLTGTPVYTAQTHLPMETGNFYTSALGDLDGDGDLDLVTGGPNGVSTSPNNVYYWNSNAERYEKTGSVFSLANIAFYGWSVVVGNFTADTKKDVLWFSTSHMYLGTNSTTTPDNITFSSITELGNEISPTSLSNSALATADVNNDGNLDVITTDQMPGGSYQLIMGNGNGTFTNSLLPLGSDGLNGSSVATGDLNKDDQSDFVLTRSKYSPYAFQLITYTRNADNTGFDSTTIYRSNSEYARPVVICDVNNDTWPDIELISSSNAYVFLNKGDGTFNAIPNLKVPTAQNELYVYDIDGNGFKDLVTAEYNSISYFPVLGVGPTSGGIISGDENICSGVIPAPVANTNGASGQIGTLEYKWEMSLTGNTSGFSDISASDSGTYQPGNLTVTTWYKRLARLSGESTWDNAVTSNIIEKTVTPAPEAPAAVELTTEYDGSMKAASAIPPVGSGINWYADAYGITISSAPSAINAGIYTAYAASEDSLTGCEDASGILVSLVITPAGLTATAENKTKTYGEVNPEFTVTYAGFVNGETEDILDIKALATCLAGTSSPAGDYEINAHGGSDHNYVFSYEPGILTVNEATGIDAAILTGYVIYPNPAKDVLNIKSANSHITNVKVFDMMGNLILNCKVEDSQIDIHELPVGVYNLKIDGRMFKLVKE
jgi:hypothetical protein